MVKSKLFRYIFKKLNIIPKTMLWRSEIHPGHLKSMVGLPNGESATRVQGVNSNASVNCAHAQRFNSTNQNKHLMAYSLQYDLKITSVNAVPALCMIVCTNVDVTMYC